MPSLSATIAPILVGAAYAWTLGSISWLLLALILLAAIACQAGANLANDYFDHRKGVDTMERPGSSRVIQDGLLSAAEIRLGMIAAFAVATILGLVIVAVTSIDVLLLAVACLAVAVFYAAGPKPLGYVALGEVAVFLAMGLALVAGTVFVLTGSFTAMSVIVSLPTAFLITAILHVNNIRDVARDRAAGKRTLAMLLGRRRSTAVYGALIGAPYGALLVIVLLSPAFWPVLVAAVTMPRAHALVRSVAGATSEDKLSRSLRGTNRLLLEVGCLVAIGIVVGAALGSPVVAL